MENLNFWGVEWRIFSPRDLSLIENSAPDPKKIAAKWFFRRFEQFWRKKIFWFEISNLNPLAEAWRGTFRASKHFKCQEIGTSHPKNSPKFHKMHCEHRPLAFLCFSWWWGTAGLKNHFRGIYTANLWFFVCRAQRKNYWKSWQSSEQQL